MNWDLGQLRNVNTMLFFVKMEWILMVLGPLLMISHLSPLITSATPPRKDFKKKKFLDLTYNQDRSM